jgi:ribosomal protein S18 acetylase RimI-like enzyme
MISTENSKKYVLREVQLPDDAQLIAHIDTSFTTDAIFEIDIVDKNIVLKEKHLEKPLRKEFPLDDLNDADRPWGKAFVIMDDGVAIGFAALGYQAWNKRLVLWHFYVDTPLRGKGLGRMLINKAEEYGKTIGAQYIWLETSNLNVPGFEIYKKLGFELCGLDKTLYAGTKSESEMALFFAKPI